jgi:hypothetical protein
VDQHRHARPADGPDQPVDPRGVIEVAVTADDGLDRGRVDAQAAHVLCHAIGAGPGVEQEPVLGARFSHRHQHREPVLGDQRVGSLPALLARPAPEPRPGAPEPARFPTISG